MSGDVRVQQAQLRDAYLGSAPSGSQDVFILPDGGGNPPAGLRGLLSVASLKARRMGFDPTTESSPGTRRVWNRRGWRWHRDLAAFSIGRLTKRTRILAFGCATRGYHELGSAYAGCEAQHRFLRLPEIPADQGTAQGFWSTAKHGGALLWVPRWLLIACGSWLSLSCRHRSSGRKAGGHVCPIELASGVLYLFFAVVFLGKCYPRSWAAVRE